MPYYRTRQSKRVSDQERQFPTAVHCIRVAFETEGSIVPAIPSSCVSELLLFDLESHCTLLALHGAFSIVK